MKEQAKTGISRRSFLTGAAATGALAAAAGLMGCAPQQVTRFLADYVQPVLDANAELVGAEVEINV